MDSIGTIGPAPRMRTATISVDGIGSPVIEAGPADATDAVVFVQTALRRHKPDRMEALPC
jgi:hypothetical protein